MRENDSCPQDAWKCNGKLQYDKETKTLFCPVCLFEENQENYGGRGLRLNVK